MKRKRKNQKGFTLIELIMVIVILGFLSVTAFSLFVNYGPQSADASLDGTLASIRTGFVSWYIDPTKGNVTNWPSATDVDTSAAAQDPCSTCFDGVLEPDLSSPKWKQTGAATFVFKHPTRDKTCTVAGGGATATTITCI